jgi:hypothetical protein
MVSFLKVVRQKGNNHQKISQLGTIMEVKDRTTVRKNVGADHFFTDMRFWLILVMLAAFVCLLVFMNPK